ncbi:10884_t:CDS:2 [Rhizophagus irregularis]|nr:10884_t:CDS:2 [Rhizophagus irregularis]
MRYGKGLRGTRQFWIARRGELTDMIKQIGHKSLIFYNFSAADFHWPNLHRLMLDDEDTQSKPILSIHTALQYISKYTSKTEPKTPTDLLNSVLEHDISAQETCHLLNGTALYHLSRSFVYLNVNEEELKWIQGTGSRNNVEDTGRTTQSALKRYWERPEELEDYSLFELYLTHRFSRVRVWPHPSSYHNGYQWEAYCRVKVLLHVRHCNMQVLTKNGNINWSTLYDQHIDMINNASQNLLKQPVDDEEVYNEESEDELPFEEDEDEDEEQYTYDWMRLVKMGFKAIIHCASDLSSRDIDQNHNWITDA